MGWLSQSETDGSNRETLGKCVEQTFLVRFQMATTIFQAFFTHCVRLAPFHSDVVANSLCGGLQYTTGSPSPAPSGVPLGGACGGLRFSREDTRQFLEASDCLYSSKAEGGLQGVPPRLRRRSDQSAIIALS